MSIKSSFISTQEQVVKLNENNIKLLNGLNKIVTSKDSTIRLDVINDNDTVESIDLPTVGYLQAQLNRLDQNIKTLSGVDSRGSIVTPSNNVYQKIIKANINKEPNSFGELNPVDSFSSVNNSFFDALLNPIIAVNFDLTGKIDEDTRKVLSKRYIVKFERDEFGNLTDQGATAENLFNENFKGRTDITQEELENWILNTPGLHIKANGEKIVYDEQYFDLNPNNLEYDGLFTILGVEEDPVNRKMWYLFDTITYYKIKTKEEYQLKIEDQVIINSEFATTRWKIIEISQDATQIRVNLERVEGYEALPIGIQAGLKYYSGVEQDNVIKISVGFNEYNIVFLKAVNTTNNLLSRQWSLGTAYYTNDLKLLSTSNTGEHGLSLNDYYINTVQDYGKLLQDLAEREIPTEFALKPNNVVLNADNFTVVQVNKNITDTNTTDRLKTLHAQSTSYSSELEELNKTIVEKQNELIKKHFTNPGDKQKVENEIKKLTEQANNVSKLLETTVAQIISEEALVPNIAPEFRIRGFWPIPESVSNGLTRPQEVVQFVVQFRYLSTSGQESATESFTITDENGNTINASFSNWYQQMSPLRSRSFNISTGKYEWDPEDLTNPNVLNINQLDIPIVPNVQAEIRVKAISEVGWPSVNIDSEWSDSIVIGFPTELIPPKDREATIVEQAKFDSVRLQINQDLNEKGLDTHLAGQFTDNNILYAHNADNIGVVTDAGVVKLSDRLVQIENNENVEEDKDLQLDNGWINYGSSYSKAMYYKHESRVYLTGLVRLEQRFDNEEDDFDYSKRYPDVVVRSGNPTLNTEFANIGYLPTEYRPSTIKTFLVATSIGENKVSKTGNNAFPWGRSLNNNMDLMYGRIDVYPNGLIRLVTGATGFVSLEGISFKISKNPLTQTDELTTDAILQLSRLQQNS